MSNQIIDILDMLESKYEEAKLRNTIPSLLSLSRIATLMIEMADASFGRGMINKEEHNTYTTKACKMAIEITEFYIIAIDLMKESKQTREAGS